MGRPGQVSWPVDLPTGCSPLAGQDNVSQAPRAPLRDLDLRLPSGASLPVRREKQSLHGPGLAPVPSSLTRHLWSACLTASLLLRPWFDPEQPGRVGILQDCMRCPHSVSECSHGQSEVGRDPCSIRGGEGTWKAGEVPGAGSEPQAESCGPRGGFVSRAPLTLLTWLGRWPPHHPRPRGKAPAAPACRCLSQPGPQVGLLCPFAHK